MKRFFWIFTTLLILSSCTKEEIALLPPISNERGVLITSSVNIGSDYGKQIWFNLGTNSIVKTNLRTDWDLAFDCGDDNILYLNSALTASIAFTEETNFDNVTSDAGLEYIFEHHSGKKDSLAVGEVDELRTVLIVNRGLNPAGNPLGKMKIQITAVEDGNYHMTYSKLDGSEKDTVVISKDSEFNRIAFSFNTEEVITIEPPKATYDLCFTQYSYIYVDPPIVYSVNGAIINSYKTEVAKEFNKDFSKITLEDAEKLTFSTNADVIGHHWKNYNIDKGEYSVYSKQNYIIRDSNGNLFKLRFLSFYDDMGAKGAPSFEYERL